MSYFNCFLKIIPDYTRSIRVDFHKYYNFFMRQRQVAMKPENGVESEGMEWLDIEAGFDKFNEYVKLLSIIYIAGRA